MAFSVLLSLYHKESPLFLRQSLDSIFSQTLFPDEVVLVEDGPLTDGLYAVVDEYVSRYPAVLKIVKIARNGGLGRALNEGLKHCSHELVARMDTDDIAKPDRFEKQIAFLSSHPEVDVCGAWIDEFEVSPATIRTTRRLPENHVDILAFAKRRNPINHPVVTFRKRAVQAAGGYMHFPLFEDYYLWVRMLSNGARFYNIQESLLYFRFSPEMFRRRGGLRYACDEVRFCLMLWRMGFIGVFTFLNNVFSRFTVRLMPNGLRTFLYTHFLRR